jgi:hypothetical protein
MLRPIFRGIFYALSRVKITGKARRKTLQQNADAIMLQIAALLPTEYRGYYSNDVYHNGKTYQ